MKSIRILRGEESQLRSMRFSEFESNCLKFIQERPLEITGKELVGNNVMQELHLKGPIIKSKAVKF